MRIVDQVLSIQQTYGYNAKTRRDNSEVNWLSAINECLSRLQGAHIIHISRGGEFAGPPVAMIKYIAIDPEYSLNNKSEVRIGMHVVSHVSRQTLNVNPGDIGIILGFDELPIGTVAIVQFRVRKRNWQEDRDEFSLVCCAMMAHEYDLTGDDAIAYAREMEMKSFAKEIGPVGYMEPPF